MSEKWKPLGLADEEIFEVYVNALDLYDDGLDVTYLTELLKVAEDREKYKVCAGIAKAIEQIKSELNGSNEIERH